VRDVVVVGAGPSGSFAAMKCAERGLDVLLLDSQRFPRDKACGGIVGESALRLVGGDAMSVVERVGIGNEFHYNWKHIATHHRHEYFVKRRMFDHYLVRRATAAGAELRENVRATGISIAPGCAIVSTTGGDFESKIVIGADGVNSVIGRSMGLSHHAHDCKYVAVKAEIDVSPQKARELEAEDPPRQKTYFFSDLIGFAWVVPNIGSVNVGYGSVFSRGKNLKNRFHSFLAALGLKSQLELGAQVPFITFERVYGERVMLTGDAGGFVDPWTGCGMEEGIIASSKAARICKDAIDSNDFSVSMMSRYQDLCHDQLSKIKWRGSWIKALDRVMPRESEFPFWTELIIGRLAPSM